LTKKNIQSSSSNQLFLFLKTDAFLVLFFFLFSFLVIFITHFCESSKRRMASDCEFRRICAFTASCFHSRRHLPLNLCVGVIKETDGWENVKDVAFSEREVKKSEQRFTQAAHLLRLNLFRSQPFNKL
jgi:hypothetical protein